MAVTDIDAIVDGAKRIDQASDDFGEQLGKLATTASGEPWGSDAPGTAFAKGYADLLDHAADALASHHDLLDEAVGKLVTWARSVLEAEGENVERIERLEDMLEEE